MGKVIECVKCEGRGYIWDIVEDVEYDCEPCDGFGYIKNLPEDKGFVNVYTVTRHYGGPEEGGWYYNWFDCVESFPCRYKNRAEIMEYMESEHGKKKYGDIYSVLGGQDITMMWEESPAESQSKERPHYE